VSPEQDRARGALYGLAIGDALGMPTQLLSREQIIDRWGPLLTGFEPAPPDHPVAAGMPAGAVTDETEQAVLVGRLLLSGRVDPGELADAVRAGTPPTETGRFCDTNGGAMRVTPVGIAVRSNDLTALVDRVQEASLVTHNTSVALAGAAAVAAAVSAGISGAGVAAATDAAVAAAALGAERGHWVAGADVAARIRWASALVSGRSAAVAAEVIYSLVGTSVAAQESVPAAFAVLSAVPGDPWQACLLAASLGGDSDTIAAMAGAIGGACHGLAAFPRNAIETMDGHGLELAELADSLLQLRKS
jgi:ADP-ribosylglycohydrolase